MKKLVKKFFLVWNTARYLKISQIYFQCLRRLSTPQYISKNLHLQLNNLDSGIFFSVSPKLKQLLYSKRRFRFLNRTKSFSEGVNWDFLGYGKLWNYNLEYFDYLQQDNITVTEKLRLIEDFYKFSILNKRLLEPYPVSLRAINLMKFTLSNNLKAQQFHGYLYQELQYLNKNYEYHLLGNHLLENAFALCLGGVFFSNENWHRRAIKILRRELCEQILADGAHFELSPMYHNIIFFRLLELVDWYSRYDQRQEEFLSLCRQKASLMLDWLENIKFENGDIPLFNDAANGITYEVSFLLDYAKQLGIERVDVPLGDSGYRSFENELYEIKMDFAQIGASYQPGHAHADALSFILYYRGKPLFVEQGTSTYQIGARRNLERSTEAHNAVVVNGKNQSEVWGGFRVGKRARTVIIRDEENILEATHDGYKSDGNMHRRKFVFEEDKIVICDVITGPKYNNIAYFHLSPRIQAVVYERSVSLSNNVICSFEGADSICIEQYKYADEYYQYQDATRIVVSFKKELITVVDFNER